MCFARYFGKGCRNVQGCHFTAKGMAHMLPNESKDVLWRLLCQPLYNACHDVQGCQFTAEGMVRLPPFQIPGTVLQGGGEGSEGPEVPGPLLNPADLHLLNMGQQMLCAFVNRQRRTLFLYHFYKSAQTL